MRLWLLILLLPLLLVGCTPQTEGYIDFSQTKPIETEENIYNENEEKPLRIAVASVMSSNMTITSYRDVAQYISEKMGRQVVLIQRKTYDEVNLLMSSGEADIAFMSTGGYASYRGINKVEVLVTQEFEGVDTYYVYIVTNCNDDIKRHSLLDLKGEKFAYSDPLSYSGHIAIAMRIREYGYTSDTFFSHYAYTHSHDKSLWAVKDRAVDGACVDSLVYDYAKRHNPELVKELCIIDSIGPIPSGPVVVQKNMPKETKDALQQIFLSMHENTAVLKSMKRLLVDRFILPRTELFDGVRQVYDEISEVSE